MVQCVLEKLLLPLSSDSNRPWLLFRATLLTTSQAANSVVPQTLLVTAHLLFDYLEVMRWAKRVIHEEVGHEH